MGKFLTYLFEVTQGFGMETRTELILLQRTMVVVEGVCRSLYPQINIWEVAQPVVQDYINKSVGPKALLNDIIKTGKVMSRFGPKLPKLIEDLLNNQVNSSKQKQTSYKSKKTLNFFVMGALFGALVVITLGSI
jgi:ubiquinone biosynthesis protein